jgi:hypothetical protein
MKRSRRLKIRQRRSIKGGRPPKEDVYQAKLINIWDLIDPVNLSDNTEIKTKANDYVNDSKNGVNIGDILFCGSTGSRQEYGFYIVLPQGENKIVNCLGEGWGMGWISGGVIDHKDILHKYNVKYDDLLNKKDEFYEFDVSFLGHWDHSQPKQIIDEFKKNGLTSK